MGFNAFSNVITYPTVIRKITSAGVVTTISYTNKGSRSNGTLENATFTQPDEMSYDPSGNLYINDNAFLRKVVP